MDSEHKAGIGKRLNLPRGRRLVVAVVVSVACLGAAGAAVAASSPSWTVPLHHGGTFKLAPSIVAKIKAHKPINYVFSYGSCSIQGFSQQYEAGYNASLPVANKIYPIKGTRLCPPQTQQNVTQQISQIDALLNTGQIDCLSIEPQDSTSMASVVQQALAKGIPTFTVGLTTFGNELTNFTQVPQKEGATAAKTVLTYMKAHKLHFKTFAVSGGDPTQYWAVQRAKGFRLAIQKAIPGAKFVTTEKNMLNTTYTPGTTYDTYKAFLTGAGKNVQVIENVDIGGGIAAKVISDLGLKGKAFSLGWNDTPDQVAAIKAGTEIALFDQNWPQQAAFGAVACAQFMKTGKVFPNIQVEHGISKANLSTGLGQLANFTKYALTGLTSGIPTK
jgi:ABC-type sugar transport system substrate-binding protein